MKRDRDTRCSCSAVSLERLVKALAVVSTILSVVCIILVTLIWKSTKECISETPSHPCVKCTLLEDYLTEPYAGPLLKKLSRIKDKDGRDTICCADSPKQVSALWEAVLNEKTTQKCEPVPHLPLYDVSDFTYSPDSAHIRLRPSVEYETTEDMVPQFPNNSYVPLKLDLARTSSVEWEHVRNVQILSTGIKVTHSGWYFVYSGIRFNPDSSRPCGDYDKQTWEHHVLRNRPNNKHSTGLILRTLHTCCDICVREKSTNYAGGVFYLEAGDHLSVEVSGYALIRFDRDASYIGLYMLGD